MLQLPVPSKALLRAFCRPSTTKCRAYNTEANSNFMPRHKYAKVNRLDKLHRLQKKEMKQEKEASHTRAALIQETIAASGQLTEAAELPFHIGRTGTKNLAIYEDAKAGGSKHITTVRKLSGDLRELQRQIRTILQLPEFTIDGKGRKKEPVSINPLTQQIIIKGWRGPEVKKWAETLGF